MLKVINKNFFFVFILNTLYIILNTPPCYAVDLGPEPATIQDLEKVFDNILSLAIPLAGIAAFLMLIAGGFKYLTSGGDPRKSEAAKQTITYALVGLVLFVAAFLIIQFLSDFTGVDLTKFFIPGP